eukprot:scaffold52785_cov48-Cyclotella_meneghiniana.AAC.4
MVRRASMRAASRWAASVMESAEWMSQNSTKLSSMIQSSACSMPWSVCFEWLELEVRAQIQ